MTTNTTPILDLWKAMRELDKVLDSRGEQGIIPGTIEYHEQETTLGVERYWEYWHPLAGVTLITEQHVLYILTGHAEAWLLDRSWNLIAPGSTYDREYESPEQDGRYISLPDALRAEAGRK